MRHEIKKYRIEVSWRGCWMARSRWKRYGFDGPGVDETIRLTVIEAAKKEFADARGVVVSNRGVGYPILHKILARPNGNKGPWGGLLVNVYVDAEIRYVGGGTLRVHPADIGALDFQFNSHERARTGLEMHRWAGPQGNRCY